MGIDWNRAKQTKDDTERRKDIMRPADGQGVYLIITRDMSKPDEDVQLYDGDVAVHFTQMFKVKGKSDTITVADPTYTAENYSRFQGLLEDGGERDLDDVLSGAKIAVDHPRGRNDRTRPSKQYAFSAIRVGATDDTMEEPPKLRRPECGVLMLPRTAYEGVLRVLGRNRNPDPTDPQHFLPVIISREGGDRTTYEVQAGYGEWSDRIEFADLDEKTREHVEQHCVPGGEMDALQTVARFCKSREQVVEVLGEGSGGRRASSRRSSRRTETPKSSAKVASKKAKMHFENLVCVEVESEGEVRLTVEGAEGTALKALGRLGFSEHDGAMVCLPGDGRDRVVSAFEKFGGTVTQATADDDDDDAFLADLAALDDDLADDD